MTAFVSLLAGGAAAVAAQAGAVAVLRPGMRAAQPEFMARWLGGMAIRAGMLAVLVVLAATRPSVFQPLTGLLGFVGVLLPLLFVETRFLR